jgi:ComF family protein
MIDSILNFIFPTACVICNAQVLERRFSAVCAECWDTLSPIRAPLCSKCGMPAIAIEGPCGRCRTGENLFDYARSAVLFNPTARKIVHHLKYADRVSLAKPIGRILQDLMERENFVGELIIPVPLHRSRRRERGFNQAELIARNLALPVDPKILRRQKHTPSQTGLSRAERARNLAGAFELRGSAAGARLLVVDDVMTTGATMNEIAKLLKRAKAARVEVLTFARVPDGASLL